MSKENNDNNNKLNDKELPFCESTETAEQSRLWEDNEPCDCSIRGRV